MDRLRRVNEQLWDAEDEVRACERAHDFGAHFISRARSIYRLNDKRTATKRQIDLLVGSELLEGKEYVAGPMSVGGCRP